MYRQSSLGMVVTYMHKTPRDDCPIRKEMTASIPLSRQFRYVSMDIHATWGPSLASGLLNLNLISSVFRLFVRNTYPWFVIKRGRKWGLASSKTHFAALPSSMQTAHMAQPALSLSVREWLRRCRWCRCQLLRVVGIWSSLRWGRLAICLRREWWNEEMSEWTKEWIIKWTDRNTNINGASTRAWLTERDLGESGGQEGDDGNTGRNGQAKEFVIYLLTFPADWNATQLRISTHWFNKALKSAVKHSLRARDFDDGWTGR